MDDRSPYAPPSATVTTAAQQRGSAWKAVVLGLLTDIGGSIITSVVIGIAYAAVLASSGMAQEEAMQAFMELEQNTTLMLLMYSVGGLFSVLGGYVCARIVRYNELRWAMFVALGSAAAGAVLGSQEEPAMQILLLGTTVASVLLGAWLGARVNRRRLAALGLPA